MSKQSNDSTGSERKLSCAEWYTELVKVTKEAYGLAAQSALRDAALLEDAIVWGINKDCQCGQFRAQPRPAIQPLDHNKQ